MITVVALLVVLATLGAALVLVSTTRQAGAALDLQGVRAYYAARSGLEWALYQSLRTGGTGCAAIHGTTFAFTGNLSGFSVSIACTATVHEEGSAVSMYAITATGCNEAACPTAATPPGPFYVERQLRVTASN